MRTSFSWLFIPSLTLSLPFSLSAATENLSSQNSFSGSGTFTPKTLSDSNGDTLNFLGDVLIVNAGSSSALTASCFGQTQGDFILQGNGFSLSFNSITATDSVDGVAISSTATNPGKALSLLGFSNLFFTLSPASGGTGAGTGTTGKGAVNSTGSALLQGNTNVIFSKNATTENGGALHATGTVTCTNNASLSFQQNTATTNGGALYTMGEVILSDTSGSVTFIGNSAALGGALYCQGNGFITNNFLVDFEGNSTTGTTGNGGAIYCSQATPTQPPQAPATPAPVLTISGNQYVNFLNNSATSNGGAIYTNKLVLSAGGPTLFQNNTVTNETTAKGGPLRLQKMV